MRAYLAILSTHFRTLLQYRAAAFAGFITQLFWGLIRIMIFHAFYYPPGAIEPLANQPMSFPQVVTYVWLSQATIRLLLWRGDAGIDQMIRSGTVAYELLRPTDLYGLWYMRHLAAVTAPTLLRAVPMFILAGLCLGLQPPASVAAAGLWLLATGSAVLLAAALGMIASISMLWTLSGRGMAIVMNAGVWILSGMVLPLPLFPDWLQPVLNFLPFRGLMDVPFRLYMGHIAPAGALGAILHQLAWLAVLVVIGRWLLATGKRRLVVQGG
jgi:ABC-2 type transport system permease protein